MVKEVEDEDNRLNCCCWMKNDQMSGSYCLD